ncbi:hypothetical protein, partial [Brevundimonas sp.]|uniref:hypothetical protein n=1 Tax=Brevundimonas sp. TaxID=1871086 RepID=UPI003564E9C5
CPEKVFHGQAEPTGRRIILTARSSSTEGKCRMDAETRTLVDRWFLAFSEARVLIDTELMRGLLADVDEARGRSTANGGQEF